MFHQVASLVSPVSFIPIDIAYDVTESQKFQGFHSLGERQREWRIRSSKITMSVVLTHVKRRMENVGDVVGPRVMRLYIGGPLDPVM